MAIEIWQQHQEDTSAINSTDRVSCRLVAPRPHTIRKAYVVTQSIIMTGTVEIQLRYADPGGTRTGQLIGEIITNDDLTAVTDTQTRTEFELAIEDKELAPRWRNYFVVFTGTNAADRLNDPTLVLEVETV